MVGWRRKRRRRRGDNCDCDCAQPFCDALPLSALLRLCVLPSRTPWVDRSLTAAIRGYRRVSPRLPTRCRYVPTCSAYGLAAVERYGARVGMRLIVARLARCRPGVTWGTADPVP